MFDHIITLEYRLRNGLRLTRSFYIPRAAFDVRSKILSIYDLQEHKDLHNPLFYIALSQFTAFEIMDDFTDVITPVSKEQAAKIIESLQEESRAEPGFDAEPYQNPVASILIRNHYNTLYWQFDEENRDIHDWEYFDDCLYPPYRYRFSIYPNYINTIKLLEEFTDRSFTTFPEGTKAVVTRLLPVGHWHDFNFNLADTYQVLNLDIVSDTEKLQALRDSSVKYSITERMPNGDFLQFYFPDGTRSRLFYIWHPDIPDFYRYLNFRRLEHEEIRPFLSSLCIPVPPDTAPRGFRTVTSQ